MSSPNEDSQPACSCKVGKLTKKYDLTDKNENLVARWTGEQGDKESIRKITDEFNQKLLHTKMHAAGMEIIEGRVENLYRLLIDENRLDAVQIQARSHLDNGGVNVDRLEDHFISHQTMYRHLKNCLNAKKEPNILATEKELKRIHSIQNRAEVVVDNSIARLRDGGKLDLDEFEVLINFRATCEDCGTLYDVTDLLDNGGCECQQ